jgi:acyl-coenzyme A thioesterase PaaI-like protein
LHSWLIFTNVLTDADHQVVLSQHIEMGGSLATHLETAYGMALQCRLNIHASNKTPDFDALL